jgi:anion-transporting  ArsA/GET3 family ATPase
MLNELKDMAAKQVGRVLASDATMRMLSSPQVKTVLVKAINFRAEAREVVEKRAKDVAEALELVTRDDVARLKRSIRDLQDTVDELREQLTEAQEGAAIQPVHAAAPVAKKAGAEPADKPVKARKPPARKAKAAE